MRPRTFIVSRAEAGRNLADCLRARLALAHEVVVRLVRQRQVRLNGSPCLDPSRRLQSGQRIEVLSDTPKAPRTDTRRLQPRSSQQSEEVGPRAKEVVPTVRFFDDHVVVVEKPAGLTTMRHAEDVAEFGSRAKRFLPQTLADLLPTLLPTGRRGRPLPVRAVHRLDKETSGLVVFARTVEAERHLGQQFRAHSTERLYLAVVRGKAQAARIDSLLVRDRGDGRRGSSANSAGEGQRAITHVRVVEDLGDFTLVECRLETGRTHQVRIHLGEAGTPLCGEKVYDRPLHGRPVPDGSGAPRITLHAATLGFDHPVTGERMRWESPLPKDMARLVERLRRRKSEGGTADSG